MGDLLTFFLINILYFCVGEQLEQIQRTIVKFKLAETYG